MSDLALHDGLWWPASDRHARPVIVRDAEPSVAWLLEQVPGRDLIVQAGGNVGLYALMLAERFAQVVTAEPDDANHACFVKNLEDARDARRIHLRYAALGETEGYAKVIVVEEGNCGAHRIGPSSEGVRVLTIDSLNLPACDALFLDIEGFELPALKGAAKTIERFSPVIAVEMKGLGEIYGHSDAELHDFCVGLGYDQVSAFGNDRLYKRSSR